MMVKPMNYTIDSINPSAEIIWIAGVKYLYDGRMVHTIRPSFVSETAARRSTAFSYIVKKT